MDEGFMLAVYGVTYDDLYDCKNCLCGKCAQVSKEKCYGNCYMGASACVTYDCEKYEKK